MSVKIQINSLEALERLIGGDSSIEIDIRNSIVQEFTKKHLKAIINNELVSKLGLAAANEVRNEFIEEKKTGTWNTTYLLKDKTKELVSDFVKSKVRTELSEMVEEAIKATEIRETINSMLESQSTWIVEKLTESNLEQRLNKMVDKKLKEKLGIS